MFWNITSQVASCPKVSSYTHVSIGCNIKCSRHKGKRRHMNITMNRKGSFGPVKKRRSRKETLHLESKHYGAHRVQTLLNGKSITSRKIFYALIAFSGGCPKGQNYFLEPGSLLCIISWCVTVTLHFYFCHNPFSCFGHMLSTFFLLPIVSSVLVNFLISLLLHLKFNWW